MMREHIVLEVSGTEITVTTKATVIKVRIRQSARLARDGAAHTEPAPAINFVSKRPPLGSPGEFYTDQVWEERTAYTRRST